MLSMILAVARNGALGRRGGLPWSYPEDRAHFDATTRGHVVIMGRRTWEEEGQPLAERTNVVVSSSFVPPPGVLAVRSFEEAIAHAAPLDPDPFVIGGAVLFRAALPRVQRIYLTEIPEEPEADVFFTFDRAPFVVASEREGARGVRFLVLERAASA